MLVLIRPAQPWKKLYQLQLITLVLFAGFVPMGIGLISLRGENAFYVLAPIYAGLFLFAEDRMINWPCPRCGKAFLRRNGVGFAAPFRFHCGTCRCRRGSLTIR